MGNTVEAAIELQETEIHPPPSPPSSATTNLTCEICIEPISSAQKFINTPLCSHPYCTDCMIKYIQVKLQDNVSLIPCPAVHCSHTLHPISMQPLISPTLFIKWCDLLCESTMLGIEKCYCPYENCSALVIDECGGGDVKKTKCPNCKRWFCFKCKVKWHAGYRCGERRDLNDITFGILAERRGWMRCPRCRHFVELVQGCKIIKCRCDISFCYRCGKQVHHHFCRCDKASMCCLWCVRVSTAIVCFSGLFISIFWLKMALNHLR